MISPIKKIIHREKFNLTLLGLCINHNFTIRRLVYKSWKKNASLLPGRILDFGYGSKPYQHLLLNTTEYLSVDYEVEERT